MAFLAKSRRINGSSAKARMSGVRPLPLSPDSSAVLADSIKFLENEYVTRC